MLRLLLFLVAVTTLPAKAEEVIAGLSEGRVAITADFGGSKILVFGAIKREAPPPSTSPLEIIITVEGPRSGIEIRKKSRRAGIWLNNKSVDIESAPAFYSIATTAPLFNSLSYAEDIRHGISIRRGIRTAGAIYNETTTTEFTDALIRLKLREGLYRIAQGSIFLRQNTLFHTSVALPENVIEGTYEVRIFLTREKEVIDVYTTNIYVRKVGLERFLHNLAYERPLLYGLLAIVIAAIAGWGASAIFRLIRI